MTEEEHVVVPIPPAFLRYLHVAPQPLSSMHRPTMDRPHHNQAPLCPVYYRDAGKALALVELKCGGEGAGTERMNQHTSTDPCQRVAYWRKIFARAGECPLCRGWVGAWQG